MTALTKDISRIYELGDISEIPVKGGVMIFQGAAVGGNGIGYAKPLQIGDLFLGFAEECVDNLTSPDGTKNIRIRKRGSILLDIPGVTLAAITKSVYATDDNNFTLVPNNSCYIGKISRIEANGLALVEFSLV
jgi:hypothetical protein